MNVLENSKTTELKNTSIQEQVEREIALLSQKKRKDQSSLERVRLLQLKLYLRAKQAGGNSFYILYDKLFLGYVLEVAFDRVASKSSSPGIDNQTINDIRAYGKGKFLAELGEELRTRTYRPSAVKRKMIDKENGGQRPLGIPTIKDRIAQQACKLVIEPIFEADFAELSYGFRPNRSARQAITKIRDHLRSGKTSVYDADLSKYFDTIPHDKLMIAIRERISDPRVIHIIKLWLKVPIVEEDGRYTGGKRNTKGTPQGGVISPLLANIYMNLLDRIVNTGSGYFGRRGIEMIRYADDFILMSKQITTSTIDKIHGYLTRMGLGINTTKSRKVNAEEASFDFLGFTIRYDRSILYKGTRFWHILPKSKSLQKIRQKLNKKLKLIGHYPPADVVRELNPVIRGWMNYYRIEKVSYTQVAFRKLSGYLRYRLPRYYHRKSQRRSRLYGQQAFDKLVKEYGLINPYKTSGIRPVNTLR